MTEAIEEKNKVSEVPKKALKKIPFAKRKKVKTMVKARCNRTHHWSSKSRLQVGAKLSEWCDHIKLMLAAAWNLSKWLMAVFWLFFSERKIKVFE